MGTHCYQCCQSPHGSNANFIRTHSNAPRTHLLPRVAQLVPTQPLEAHRRKGGRGMRCQACRRVEHLEGVREEGVERSEWQEALGLLFERGGGRGERNVGC